MELLAEARIKLSSAKRTLLIPARNFPVEVLFLRDDDIPDSVASGVADVGIVGENEFVEKEKAAEIVKRLGFSKCRLSLAIPKDEDYQNLNWFHGRKIATSYPGILSTFLKKKFKIALLNPLLISIILSIVVLVTADIDYDVYNAGASYLSWFLTPATVCLAIPLYEEWQLLKKNWKAF